MKVSDQDFIDGWKRAKSIKAFAEFVGLDIRNVLDRRKKIEARYGILLDAPNKTGQTRSRAHVEKIGFRITEDITGPVVIFSDGHFWPGERSTSFEALLKVIKKLKPSMIIANGDSFDGARISRHPPTGWGETPSVSDELDCVIERHCEIENAAPDKCKLIWNCGNHDSRFTSRLAQYAPEYAGVKGTDITDHFPAWNFAWSTWLNDKVVIKHRHHNGVHGAYNNVLKGGKTIITGHTHRLQAVQFADYNGLRYGIECGTLSEFAPTSDKFCYGEDNPFNWSQGFLVLTFDQNRMLLEPEFCRVMPDGKAYFRGQAQ
jgi:metallophosphoesterase superfamily enzyme